VTQSSSDHELIAREDRFGARIYAPLDVIIERGDDVWVPDINGQSYLDCLSAYSAVNFGHSHPQLLAAARSQLERVTLTSRAFRNSRLPDFLAGLCKLFDYDKALPMNTGAEAVETAIKAARKWGYESKGVAPDQADIIVCSNNFHGRTISIIAFSSEPAYKRNFGPFPAGFSTVPFGDAAALEQAITPETVAFLVEPIQGEAGIIIPPEGYLAEAAEICRRNNVLFIADEIQTGLGRTGRLLATDHEGARPDLVILGKSLGGGIYPVSAVLGSDEVLGAFRPGDHGSTFSGNPFGAAVGLAVLDLLGNKNLYDNVRKAGNQLISSWQAIDNPLIRSVRGKGLMIGIELAVPARALCERLAQQGILCKETHDTVLRVAPPLTIDEDTTSWLSEVIAENLEDFSG
jgi:ornithine--oxo-acid transaminase